MVRFSWLKITGVIVFVLLIVLSTGTDSSLSAMSNPFKTVQTEPPYSGTIFLDPDIITPSDPTTFVSAPYAGQGIRTMFDRRVNDWVTVNAFLFNASFSDGLSAEIQVNPEFGTSDAAAVEAEKYGRVIGQLPHVLRTDLQTVWIHLGTQPFGGGNNNILIHTGQSALYEADGILEETLVHEASHTSLDAIHAAAEGWLAAQTADGNFISTYARDNPTREDVAESFLPWLALRYRLGRISQSLTDTFTQTMPSRIAYFDAQAFDVSPLVAIPDLVARDDVVSTAVNTPVTISVLDNDGDANSDPFTITTASAPSNGTTERVGSSFVYTPTTDFRGTMTFAYEIATFAESDGALVTVIVGEGEEKVFLPWVQR